MRKIKVTAGKWSGKRSGLIVGLLVVAICALALAARAYFTATVKPQTNTVAMASLDLEITSEDGSAPVPLDMQNAYPGSRHAICGKITNKGTADLLMRMQVGNGNDDFNWLARVVRYHLEIKSASGEPVHVSEGYLDQFNAENRRMNMLVSRGLSYAYNLEVSIPEDMDDHTTSLNEDDNEYQGLHARFDLLAQSTQTGNGEWTGF